MKRNAPKIARPEEVKEKMRLGSVSTLSVQGLEKLERTFKEPSKIRGTMNSQEEPPRAIDGHPRVILQRTRTSPFLHKNQSFNQLAMNGTC
jgi:hypothetical protein